MNLNLWDPFELAVDIPEATTTTLRSGHATCLRFNRKGDLLASGRVDGVVVVFDVETSGIACKLKGHIKQIQSLSWSRDGRYLLSSSQDWKCILWDLQDGSMKRTVRFEAAVYIAELHPYNHLMFVAAMFESPPLIVDMRDGITNKIELSSAPKRAKQDDGEAVNEKQAAADAKITTTVAVWSGSGHHVISGTNKGWINIIDVATSETIYSTKICAGLVIFLRMNSSGREMLVNSSDRIIRVVKLPDLSDPNLDPDEIHLQTEHKFQDVVNRLNWNHVAFSASGEFVTASTFNNHDIYIWERSHGSLVKILEGAREEKGSVEWHPFKALIAAAGLESGRIHIWSKASPQKWSALAPDFVEVERNVDYIEQEDEFDMYDEDEIKQRKMNLENEDVDVLTNELTKGEVKGESDFRMPVILDLEDSESEEEFILVGTGTMRRKDPNEGKEFLEDNEVKTDGEGSVAGGKKSGRATGRKKR